jgi:hypothetical protein
MIVDPQNPRLRPRYADASIVQPLQHTIEVTQFFPLFGPIRDIWPVMHQFSVILRVALITEQEACGIHRRILEWPATKLFNPLKATVIQLAGVAYIAIVIENGGFPTHCSLDSSFAIAINRYFS